MTSLLPPLLSPRPHDRASRGLVLVASVGGVVAALATLTVALAVGVVGWFLTDAGAHGTPSDALEVGALGWLVGHGSGVTIRGTAVTMVPLGLTLVQAVVCWRLGQRVGEALAPHGPDAAGIADGERDWTVPAGVGLFAAGYVVVAVLVGVLASPPDGDTSLPAIVLGSLALAGGVGGTAIAISSGRAAGWVARLPEEVRDTVAAATGIVLVTAALSALLAAVGLAVAFPEIASVLSQLQTGPGTAVLIIALCLLLVPNVVVLAASYGLGPGFVFGTGTVVSPALVVLGPLPLFPVVAGTPTTAAPGWLSAALGVVPFLLAGAVVAQVQRGRPTTRFDVGLVRGGAAGVLAGGVVGLAAWLAGGAVGPGRMADVGPFVGDVTVHAVVAFATGGMVGGLLATVSQRRAYLDD
ncbi:DUF6350 family protein [Nocardioides alkalitolerans]|uniref:cell division protein PerM n=1 Tax=Nocardioides alkalitolerans TaxID=281714 RepID=UPI00048EC550|nr:DUF6350 family protein [Nocardioides alkalitolerans]